MAMMLSACGGGGGGGSSDQGGADAEMPAPPVPGGNSVRALAVTVEEAQGANCPTGGKRIHAGLDRDGSGSLDPWEIRSTHFVCNPEVGVGNAGVQSLVTITAEAPGAHCASGGQQIRSGPDSNGNGILDVTEVSATGYVCDGEPMGSGDGSGNGLNNLVALVSEPADANCPHGGKQLRTGSDTNRNGMLDSDEISGKSYVCNGSNGADGTNGLSTLVSIVTEPAGPHCASGGNRISAGPDDNANGQLDAGEVLSVSFVCHGTSGTNGTGGNGAPGPAGADGLSTLAVIVTEPAGAHCAAGGSKISFGPDSNANGVLEESETSSSSYVCNGTHGANGSNGTDGANGIHGGNGTAGINSLVAITNEAAGANCTSGGKKIESGLDSNASGVLDPAEVTSTSYVCNGINGSDGANGLNGTNGTNGTNGLNSLLAPVTEAPGANCASGGQRIDSGLDSNNNGVLDAGEVTISSYLCHGAPGSASAWVNTVATAVQTVSNTGYLASNAVQVTFILPASPAIGDVIQISGAGAGGWKVAQNAGQFIGTQNLFQGDGAIAKSTTTVGLLGSVSGRKSDTIDLIYAGGGRFAVSTAAGLFDVQ